MLVESCKQAGGRRSPPFLWRWAHGARPARFMPVGVGAGGNRCLRRRCYRDHKEEAGELVPGT